jgi:ubiquinol-cytochrome c reductase core subunit 2
MAINSAHSLAFHRGLGVPTASASQTPYTKYLEADTIEWFSKIAYAKPNFAVVANGAEHSELNKWVNEFFGNVPASPLEQLTTGTEQTKYHGGQERIAYDGLNTMVIGFPGSSSFTGKFYKPELAVLASLIGGQSSIKWSPGFSLLGNAKASPGTKVNTTSAIYSDAGLLYTTITGNAPNVAKTAYAAVELIQKIASGDIAAEDIQKAKAAAKFKELENGQDITAGLVLTGSGLVHNTQAYQIDEVAKAIDGVTDEAVKSVSSALRKRFLEKLLMIIIRPLSHYSRAKHRYQPLVTSLSYPLLRILASRCKYSKSRRWRRKTWLGPGLRVPLPVIVPDRRVLYEQFSLCCQTLCHCLNFLYADDTSRRLSKYSIVEFT